MANVRPTLTELEAFCIVSALEKCASKEETKKIQKALVRGKDKILKAMYDSAGRRRTPLKPKSKIDILSILGS